MSPEFAEIVNPLFTNVLRLSERAKVERLDLNAERIKIKNHIDHATSVASRSRGNLTPDTFEAAKPALIYWVDDVMTRADDRWKEHTLEAEFYNVQDRAWRFFIDCDRLAQHSADVVEVFYLALVLGFRGDPAHGFHEVGRPIPEQSSAESAEEYTIRLLKIWGEELRSRIPQLAADARPPQPALDNNVGPLNGRRNLKLALGWTVGLGALFVTLLVKKLI